MISKSHIFEWSCIIRSFFPETGEIRISVLQLLLIMI